MIPHRVSLYPQNKLIARWAYDKLSLTRMPGKNAFITVHPHPFIAQAHRNIFKKIKQITKKKIKQKIRKSKKG